LIPPEEREKTDFIWSREQITLEKNVNIHARAKRDERGARAKSCNVLDDAIDAEM